MSTFLVTLTVTLVAIAGVMAVAIKDPEQPATLRERSRRERTPRRSQRARSPRPRQAAAAPAAAATATLERDAGSLTEQWVVAPGGPSGWLRLRSGVVLTVLLAVVGALVAAGVAGIVILVALALRSAVS